MRQWQKVQELPWAGKLNEYAMYGLFRILLLVVVGCCNSAASAQSADTSSALNRNIVILKDPRIDYLLKVYAAKSRTKPELRRIYRVQLSSSRSRTEINDLKTQFSAKYPGIPVYMSFDPPTFKLRVGNFASRHDAEQFLKEIRKSYSASFIVEQ
jgi:hypothetical protein